MKKLGILIGFFFLLSACNANQDNIQVYIRDADSGTREAFESILDLDEISMEAVETSGNSDMAKQVGENKEAIGYVSFTTDLDKNHLKVLAYEGVLPSEKTVNAKEYKLTRPFVFMTRATGDFSSDRQEQLVRAFVAYLTESIEGKTVISASGGISDMSQAKPWSEIKKEHPIVEEDNSDLVLKTGGSTSVEKGIHEAVKSFIPLAGQFQYEPQHTGSSDGYLRTLGSEKDGPNAVDIGFASRELKKEEDITLAMESGTYAYDAILIVVHKENKLHEIDQETVQKVFSGNYQKWSEIIP